MSLGLTHIDDMLIAIVVSVVATLIASGLLWFFRRQVSETLRSLDMSAGAVFAWIVVFICLAVVIVFSVVGIDIPSTINAIAVVGFGLLVGATVWRRR